MPVLTNHRHDRFVQGLISRGTATAAYIAAGYSKRGAAQSAQRLLKTAEIQARKAELEEKVVAEFVGGQIADRQYRLAMLQDLLDRLLALINERAAAYGDAAPGGATGLLMRTVRTIGTGKRARRVEEYTFDKAVVMEVREHLKHAAIETGPLEEKQSHRTATNQHSDLKNYTVEELYEEQRLLLEVKAKMEVFRTRQEGLIEAGTEPLKGFRQATRSANPISTCMTRDLVVQFHPATTLKYNS
jgi:hypothetical protein